MAGKKKVEAKTPMREWLKNAAEEKAFMEFYKCAIIGSSASPEQLYPVVVADIAYDVAKAAVDVLRQKNPKLLRGWR